MVSGSGKVLYGKDAVADFRIKLPLEKYDQTEFNVTHVFPKKCQGCSCGAAIYYTKKVSKETNKAMAFMRFAWIKYNASAGRFQFSTKTATVKCNDASTNLPTKSCES